MATVAQLGARTLRRLGVAVLPGLGPDAGRVALPDLAVRALRVLGVAPPGLGTGTVPGTVTVTVADLAARALRRLGANPAGEGAAAPSAVVAVPLIAARALAVLGVNAVAQADTLPGGGAVATLGQLGARVLAALGVNPVPQGGAAAPQGTVAATEIAARALRLLGVNPVDAADVLGSDAALAGVGAIATRALLRLGVVAADETPATEDQVEAERIVAAVHDGLSTRHLVGWTRDAVPPRAAELYAVMAAALLAPAFGKAGDAATYQRAEEAIRQLALQGSVAQARAEAAVQAVQAGLAALDYVAWGTEAIPASVAEAYAAMAAQMLAPVHGLAADMAAYAAAQERVRRVALSGAAGQALAEARLRTVHESLAALNLVRWEASSVPESVGADYVRMAAQLVAPSYGQAADLAAYAAAQEAVRRVVLAGAAAQARAEAEVGAVHAALAALRVAGWGLHAIPVQAVEAYAEMTAQHLAPVYGRTADLAAIAAAEGRLRRLALSGAAGQALAVAKVAAVHDALHARGLTAWALACVPQAVAEEYATMAAVLLAPGYGATGDPAAYAAAEDRVRQVAALRDVAAQAESVLRAIHAELAATGLAGWDVEAAPLAVVEPLVAMAAQRLAPGLGRAADAVAYAGAETQLRRVAMGGTAGQALAEQKLRAVHASLDARGRTRWTLFDIPDYAEEPYVGMAAFLLGPEFGQAVNAAWWSEAEAALARAVALPSLGGPVPMEAF